MSGHILCHHSQDEVWQSCIDIYAVKKDILEQL